MVEMIEKEIDFSKMPNIIKNIKFNDTKTAIVVVDVQNDFVDGLLAVPNAKDIILPIEVFIVNTYYKTSGTKFVFTRDMHPANHCSFKENGGLWPAHCVENTNGAEFAFSKEFINDFLPKISNDYIELKKGFESDQEEYSPFNNNVTYSKLAEERLMQLTKLNHIQDMYVFGLATDYCVKNTAIDLKNAGFNVFVISDLCKGVNPETTREAFEEMKSAGVVIL